MPDTRSSAGRGRGPRASLVHAAALALAALLGCQREVDTHPFHAALTFDDGTSALPASPRQGVTDLVSGTAERLEDGAVRITPATGGPVTLTFDTSTRARLPSAPAEGVVALRVAYDLDAVDPDGLPLPVRALKLSDVTGATFILAEGSVALPGGLPAVVLPAGPESFGEDVPVLTAVSGRVIFEPDRCGDQYYDFLDVASLQGGRRATLDRGSERTVQLPEGTRPWTVRHVLTWHRVGSGCAGKPDAWIQAAAWR